MAPFRKSSSQRVTLTVGLGKLHERIAGSREVKSMGGGKRRDRTKSNECAQKSLYAEKINSISTIVRLFQQFGRWQLLLVFLPKVVGKTGCNVLIYS